jgi:predicted dehydrogenase
MPVGPIITGPVVVTLTTADRKLENVTYQAGIIGTGGIAGMGILGMHDEGQIGREKVRASHAGGYAATDDIELIAVADVDRDKLDTFGDAWEIPASRRYESHREMLEIETLDVVSVCTPTMYHRDHVVDAARVGEPAVIWCEKPIASSVADATEMTDICDETGTELVINHSFRFTEKIERLRRLINDRNILGTVRSVSAQYRMELLRNSTHVLDTLVYLFGLDPQRIAGHITGENEAVETLGADIDVTDAGGGGYVVGADGTFVTVDCTVPRAESSMTFNVVGDRGKLYLNNDDGEWRYWRLEDGTHVEADLPGITGSWTWDDDYESAFPNAAAHVAALAAGDVDNRSPGVEATTSLEIIVGFYLSHFTGGQVTPPLDESLRHVTVSSW